MQAAIVGRVTQRKITYLADNKHDKAKCLFKEHNSIETCKVSSLLQRPSLSTVKLAKRG